MKSNREKVFRNFKGDITNMIFISMSLKYTMNETKNNITILCLNSKSRAKKKKKKRNDG